MLRKYAQNGLDSLFKFSGNFYFLHKQLRKSCLNAAGKSGYSVKRNSMTMQNKITD